MQVLEKLFIKIIDNTKNRKFKINAEMMNLLGCSKEDFYKLMDKMNYKKDKKEEDAYIFMGDDRIKKEKVKSINKSNPFSKLLSLNIK